MQMAISCRQHMLQSKTSTSMKKQVSSLPCRSCQMKMPGIMPVQGTQPPCLPASTSESTAGRPMVRSVCQDKKNALSQPCKWNKPRENKAMQENIYQRFPASSKNGNVEKWEYERQNKTEAPLQEHKPEHKCHCLIPTCDACTSEARHARARREHWNMLFPQHQK